jgi:hypothetical protein
MRLIRSGTRQRRGRGGCTASDLVAALEAGAVAGAQSEVVELDGMASASRGSLFADGWDEGVRAVSEARTGTGRGAVAGRPGPLNWPYISRT